MHLRMMVLAAALAAAASAAYAQEDFRVDEMQELSAKPGTEVNHFKDGTASVTTWTRNGVMLERKVDGSRITVFGNDNTSKGAIVCTWMTYVAIRGTLALCPSEFADVRQDVDDGIAAIDDFIISNSFKPVTLAELHAREAAEYDKERAAAEVNLGGGPDLCKSGDTGKMVFYLAEMPHEHRVQSLRDALSIPRWPVLNPCL